MEEHVDEVSRYASAFQDNHLILDIQQSAFLSGASWNEVVQNRITSLRTSPPTPFSAHA